MYMASRCLLAPVFSDATLAVTLIEDPCMWCVSSLGAFKTFCLSEFDYDVPSLDFFEFILLRSCGASQNCKWMSSNLKSGQCFFKYSFCPIPLFSCWNACHTWLYPKGLWGCLFFFIPFPCCFPYLIILVDLSLNSLIMSSASLNLQLSPSSGF